MCNFPNFFPPFACLPPEQLPWPLSHHQKTRRKKKKKSENRRSAPRPAREGSLRATGVKMALQIGAKVMVVRLDRLAVRGCGSLELKDVSQLVAGAFGIVSTESVVPWAGGFGKFGRFDGYGGHAAVVLLGVSGYGAENSRFYWARVARWNLLEMSAVKVGSRKHTSMPECKYGSRGKSVYFSCKNSRLLRGSTGRSTTARCWMWRAFLPLTFFTLQASWKSINFDASKQIDTCLD